MASWHKSPPTWTSAAVAAVAHYPTAKSFQATYLSASGRYLRNGEKSSPENNGNQSCIDTWDTIA